VWQSGIFLMTGQLTAQRLLLRSLCSVRQLRQMLEQKVSIRVSQTLITKPSHDFKCDARILAYRRYCRLYVTQIDMLKCVVCLCNIFGSWLVFLTFSFKSDFLRLDFSSFPFGHINMHPTSVFSIAKTICTGICCYH